ncbi:MAG TPA: NADH-quinone oxidoreductase subunit NuoB [Candidatus Binatia bacterium]|nr:NADH-quinone oxidoreductase subunit NuoB [Candidatus Binatia bacterium]
MASLIRTRWHQGKRTTRFPHAPADLPDGFRGRPVLDPSLCVDGCRACADTCPTSALAIDPLALDLGRCVFCPACTEACPTGALAYTSDHRLAATSPDALVVTGERRDEAPLVEALDRRMRSLFGRSLRLRQVCAGGCNGCESELNALGNVVFDLARFGIQFVASPRHADGLVVTGPVTRNMELALRKTWEAVPAPKLVIAVGACAISGGVFAGSPEARDGVPGDIPVDLYVPGCPPHPLTILDGILRLLGRL